MQPLLRSRSAMLLSAAPVVAAAEVFRREVAVLKSIGTEDAWIVGMLAHHVLSDRSMLLVLQLGGATLRRQMAVLQTDPQRTRKRASLIEQLVRAVRHLHDELVVAHRDLKPDNVLVRAEADGALRLKLCDFGLARPCADGARLHTLCGSPMYMAPELLKRRAEGYDGPRVDVWSLGAIVYEMLHARCPFRATNALELATNIRHGRHAPLDPRLHPLYRALLAGCFVVRPDDRLAARDLRIPIFKPGRAAPRRAR